MKTVNQPTQGTFATMANVLCARAVAIVAGALLFTGLSAKARLGESNVQIVKRYGAIEKRIDGATNEWQGLYSFKEYQIIVCYSNNISVAELVKPIEKRKFSPEEREALMNSIGGPGPWLKESKTEVLSDTWRNTATKALARVDKQILGPDSILVMSAGYAEKVIAEQTEKNKAKADGF